MVRSKPTHASVATIRKLGSLMVRNRPKLVDRPVRAVSCVFRLERPCCTLSPETAPRRAPVADLPSAFPAIKLSKRQTPAATFYAAEGRADAPSLAFVDIQKLLRCCAAPASA